MKGHARKKPAPPPKKAAPSPPPKGVGLGALMAPPAGPAGPMAGPPMASPAPMGGMPMPAQGPGAATGGLKVPIPPGIVQALLGRLSGRA